MNPLHSRTTNDLHDGNCFQFVNSLLTDTDHHCNLKIWNAYYQSNEWVAVQQYCMERIEMFIIYSLMREGKSKVRKINSKIKN